MHSSHNTTDVLDIVIARNIKSRMDLTVQVKLFSDHLPVIIAMNLNTEAEANTLAGQYSDK